MNETSTANIKQILTAFNNITTAYEDHQWLKTVHPEDIKAVFKLGFFVEKTIIKFRERKCITQFLNALKIWGETNNRCFDYDEKFYSQMCDHLLFTCLKHTTGNEKTIDIVMRMYTSLLSRERLQIAIKDLIMNSASTEAILQFTVANKSTINLDNLKHEFILSDLYKQLDGRNDDKVINFISESLTSFKVQNNLPVLLGILGLNRENAVTKLIIGSILEKMLDRSILSKQFWLALFKINRTCLGNVCVNYENFLVSLCNFLIYIGSMMEEIQTEGALKWVSNADFSLCPEISYDELREIFIFLSMFQSSVLKSYILQRLSEAQNCTNLSIWKQIRLNCS